MLKIVSRTLLRPARQLLLEARATYIRGYWPEPISQQTLSEFLEEINYFDHPKKVKNIGLIERKLNDIRTSKTKITSDDDDALQARDKDDQVKPVDEILEMLGHDAEVPELDYNDVRIEGEHLQHLAFSHGIYRDLFTPDFVPNREHINFTKEQAERLNLLVPHFWITDQPFARVALDSKEQDTVKYFEPIVGISARFVSEAPSEEDLLQAHTSYHGNIIPACEALTKPSITLDGHLLSTLTISDGAIKKESNFDSWNSGDITAANFDKNNDKYYTVMLLNLDHVHVNAANLHWMISNIKPSDQSTPLKYEELCEYLPVHGVNGLGYSRYVFVAFRHDSPMKTNEFRIDGFSLESRKFDTNSFINKHKNLNMVPVGLSWFQTTWDVSSNSIFQDYLKLKAPIYEHVQTKNETKSITNEPYPGIVPFNIFLDHGRKKKDINEQVLLERLKSVDPTNYRDQYVPPRVPPTIFKDENIPSWMTNVMFKKKNKIGYWRGLRPASAILPLDNNADLDYPLRPVTSSKKAPPEYHNLYPGRIKYKMHKNMPTSKPTNEHQAVFIQDDHEIHLDKVMKVVKEFDGKRKQKAE